MNDKFKSLLRSGWAVPVVGAVGFGAGVVVGYLGTRRQYNQIEAKIAKLEEDTVGFEFRMAEKEGEFNAQLQQAAHVTRELKEQGQELLQSLVQLRVVREEEGVQLSTQHHPSAIRAPEPEEPQDEGGAVYSIFRDADDAWDYKIELQNRDPSKPYVLHVDEFVADEKEWDSQSTLTWYEGDSILTDSQDTPIYDPVALIGPLRFGHGSLDPNVFYVRNEKLQAEYEIIRDLGSYTEIVLGQEMERRDRREIKHMNVRKFRGD
jgi:hypothetical protein